jgi:hypothetical protein
MDNVKSVLIKARDEILGELKACGQNGGVGRAMQYAPQLVSLQNAIEALDRIEQPKVDRMAAVRAAKAVKQ